MSATDISSAVESLKEHVEDDRYYHILIAVLLTVLILLIVYHLMSPCKNSFKVSRAVYDNMKAQLISTFGLTEEQAVAELKRRRMEPEELPKEKFANCLLPENKEQAIAMWKAAGVSEEQIKMLTQVYFPNL